MFDGKVISIHPPHARWDTAFMSSLLYQYNFNPPTSCEVGPGDALTNTTSFLFQSTHLMRGGTGYFVFSHRFLQFQSTHLMRGGTWKSRHCCLLKEFQSTHLMRGGTSVSGWVVDTTPISIHPPHARWDGTHGLSVGRDSHFNPPTSCEVGPGNKASAESLKISIHPPHARWDPACEIPPVVGLISIHPPHARWDTVRCPLDSSDWPFQSTHLMRGGTGLRFPQVSMSRNFNPPTSCEVGRGRSRARHS